MIERYRTIPREIWAVRVTEENLPAVARWCNSKQWLNPVHIMIETNQGEAKASVGDWVIKGITDFYPCDNTTFLKSYERVFT